VDAALGVSALAVFLPQPDGSFAVFRGAGNARTSDVRLPEDGPLVQRLAAGEPVHAEAITETFPEAGSLDLSYFFPCRV
jgi:hypothetical protein